MYAHLNILKHLRPAALAILILSASFAARANVIYQYTSAPAGVSQDLENGRTVVATDPNLIDGTFGAPFGGRWTASLTFASALVPNSTTPLHAESGDLGLTGISAKGGVLHYLGTGLGNNLKIVDDISEYGPDGPLAGTLLILNYSELGGNVTTDAAGNISAWDLSYTLHRVTAPGGQVNFGGLVWVGPDPKPVGFEDPSLSNVEMLLGLSSASSLRTIFADNLNNVEKVPALQNDFTVYDDAFWDRGISQVHFFTEGAGSFTTIQQAPSPGTLALLAAAALAWLPNKATRRRRALAVHSCNAQRAQAHE
jgi:hypothetical protein